jgi:hypothetical protein
MTMTVVMQVSEIDVRNQISDQSNPKALASLTPFRWSHCLNITSFYKSVSTGPVHLLTPGLEIIAKQ